jgi:hypothetical protein
MSGLWDRIIPGGESSDRTNAHLLKAAVYCAVRGTFSNAQILAAINSQLTVPLDANAQTDLATVVSNGSTGSAAAKIDYLERFDALNIAAENGLLTNEATYRSELNI